MWEMDDVQNMKKWEGSIGVVMATMEKFKSKRALKPEGLEKVEELIAVMKEVLEEVHRVPTLAGLAARKVAEEGLGQEAGGGVAHREAGGGQAHAGQDRGHRDCLHPLHGGGERKGPVNYCFRQIHTLIHFNKPLTED